MARWEDAIQSAAAESDVPPDLLRALVAVESGGRPGAASAKGARGLLQLVPSTAREQARLMGIEARDEDELYLPQTNLRLGAGYLARMLRLFDGDEVFAVAAYNAGPTPVKRWRERAPELSSRNVILREGYEETRRHVVRVFAWRDRYRD
jgi:soluble lytic murein transglycosylase